MYMSDREPANPLPDKKNNLSLFMVSTEQVAHSNISM